MSSDRPLGVFYGMTFDNYLKAPGLSASGLKQLARSPWHYKNRAFSEPTRAMLAGTLAHCAILEPDAMNARYVVMPEDAPRKPTKAQLAAKNPSAESREAMQWWEGFTRENGGKTLISAKEFDLCSAQLRAIKDNDYLRKLFSSGSSEVSFFWRDEQSGIYCKGRADFLTHDVRHIIDLKTCMDESPNGFGRASARLRYDLQAAHYTEGIRAIFGHKPDFIFAAISNAAPVLAVPYILTEEVQQNAEDDWRNLLDKFAECRKNDTWPAYGDGLQLLDFPAYAKASGEVEIEWSE
jgi:exodeoxyribonuclease VIII